MSWFLPTTYRHERTQCYLHRWPSSLSSQLLDFLCHWMFFMLHTCRKHIRAVEHTCTHAQLHHCTLACKMRQVAADALLLPLDAQHLSVFNGKRTQWDPCVTQHTQSSLFLSKACLMLYFPVTVQWLPSLSTQYDPFPKYKYPFLISLSIDATIYSRCES